METATVFAQLSRDSGVLEVLLFADEQDAWAYRLALIKADINDYDEDDALLYSDEEYEGRFQELIDEGQFTVSYEVWPERPIIPAGTELERFEVHIVGRTQPVYVGAWGVDHLLNFVLSHLTVESFKRVPP